MVNVANKDSETSHATRAAAPANTAETRTETVPLSAARPAHPYKKWFLLVGIVVVVAGATYFLVPLISTAVNTVSTDDAYVNGDVTYVAPRVNGQVARVLVADNNVVRKGDLLLELDSEPYEVQVNIAQAAVDAAKADLITAQAQVCGTEGKARSLQFSLVHAIEEVHDKAAELRASVAGLDTAKGVGRRGDHRHGAFASAVGDIDLAAVRGDRHADRGRRRPVIGEPITVLVAVLITDS